MPKKKVEVNQQVEIVVLSNQPDGKGGWVAQYGVHAIGGTHSGKYVQKGMFAKPPALRQFVGWGAGASSQRWTEAGDASSWARRMGYSVKSPKK